MRATRRRFVSTSLVACSASTLGGARRLLAGPLASPNEKIQQARQVGLALLAPSDRDIAHGLELHAQSIVFDSYGFAPRSAVDGAALQLASETGVSDAELADLRLEMMLSRSANSEVELREFLEAFYSAGVTCIFQNAGEEGNDPLRMLKRLAPLTALTDNLRTTCPKALQPADVRAAKQAQHVCLALTTNGVPLRQQLENTRDELRYVRLFRQLGVNMMHLTYNRRNPLGDGCGEPNDGGLSDFGRLAIAELNRLGIIVDVAHSGWRTSLEAARVSNRPIVASHTACAALHAHYRGKPDETIKAICDTGGLIGICCIPKFLGGQGDLRALLDHLDYAIKTFGAEHVAIGTDVAYVSRNSAVENTKLAKRPSARAAERWEALWPPFDFDESSAAIDSLAWTNWPLFTIGLVQRGHTDETIRRVLGENTLRVWSAQQ